MGNRLFGVVGRLAMAAGVLCVPAASFAKDVVVHAGRLIDGVSAQPRERVSILIHDGVIQEVTGGYLAPAGYEVVDLTGKTVLPGLIDCHVHLSINFEAPIINYLVKTPPTDQLVTGISNSRALLERGFTSARDVSGYTPVVVSLKKAINANKVMGPRLWVSGGMIAPTGGHGDMSMGLDPALHKPEWDDNVVSGPENAIELARSRHKAGADLVKIAISGGMASDGDDPRAMLMTDDEIKAFVDTAHALGMKVAAHAHGKTSVEHAAALGVDSIEHGTFADAETFKLMKAKGTWFVPTLQAGFDLGNLAAAHPEMLSESGRQKITTLGRLTGQNVLTAYRMGVRIAFGTDTRPGQNAHEFVLLAKAGIPPMAAIQMATLHAAELIGAPDKVGSIQPGRFGDLIATTGDPLADISVLEHVEFVMKGGDIVKQ
ncbi:MULTISPECIES: metal-dependent hydrolase family protein [unclassified Sphingobium]|uniref:metal-dependent hydrolase family protein n=1 Tax=unclassified Sphingobium TaxID=2611147 RepID=UPI0007700D9E|nr:MULTISPECIES: amidohydrolase family protein [Sphingomonadaceae]AMK24131.1 amidohydrolase [Sphingobium sp. TKS]NML91979.1 amidohydrolase family protein [Sphingobium sp. TB-6]